VDVDHVVIPLDADHAAALDELAAGVAAAAGTPLLPGRSRPHITLLAHEGLPAEQAAAAVAPVVAATPPFPVHAHGYGLFTGDDPSDLSLHVPVVRDRQLDALHRALASALSDAGAEVAGWSASGWWSPHVTLLDRELDPAALGRAVAWLAQRHHPSWRIPVERVALTGGWRERSRPEVVFALGSAVGAPEAGDGERPQSRA
jgi:2'-5' RNA ligase